MPEPTPIPMNLDPNAYTITNIAISSNEEEIGLQITSGNQLRLYTLSPKHAKRVLLLLQNNLAEYEKKFGELKTELPTINQGQTKKKKFGFEADEAQS